MSSSNFSAESESDFKEDISDYIVNLILGPKDIENSISDPNNIENTISNTVNHITPNVDTVPTKDREVIAQRMDETNEHLSKLSEKINIVIDLLRELKICINNSNNKNAH